MSESDHIPRLPDPNGPATVLTRRQFLEALGGITILFSVSECRADPDRVAGLAQTAPDFNAYVRIEETGRVTCFTGKIEMGQGIHTSLAQMLAEELDVPLERVDMVMGDTALCPSDGATVGSRTTREVGPRLRRAAAEARAVLLELGAERLGVPVDRVHAEGGYVVDRSDAARRVAFAELTRGQRIQRRVEGAMPKDPTRYAVVGKPTERRDAVAKVTGSARYTGDLTLPGLVHARILRPPVHGATLRRVDLSAARAMDGVEIVEDEELVAVLHARPDAAEAALSRVEAEWDRPEWEVDNETIFAYLESSAGPGEIEASAGNLEEGRRLATRAFDSAYLNHYVAHAPIEPHTALAQVEGDRVTVWASTQNPFGTRGQVARSLGLPEENVRVITPFVGGGFGGKNPSPQAVEVARIARAAGRPVMLAWTRSEEFFYDTFRPAAVVKIRSGLDGAGRIVLWDADVLFAGTRSSRPFYDIPHLQVRAHGSFGGGSAHPFATGAWRGPGSNTNVFAMESHVDVMAQAVGVDPLSFRLRNLADERMKRVLRTAADPFGETFAPLPSGRGLGIACTDYLGTYVAMLAAVEVDRDTGAVRVVRVVCAQDMGEVINPAGAILQIEGGICMGLGYALTEELRFQGGDVRDRNFDTYEIPRFSWVPEIEAVLVDNPTTPASGGGEPAITAVGAALANAVNDAIGVRLATLPMTPARVLAGLAER